MQVQLPQKNLDAFYSLWTDPPELLREVYEREAGDRIILVFSNKALVFKANQDNDTISVRSRDMTTFHIQKSFEKSCSGVWQEFIGKSFGWGWVTINQQGYCDGVLLSFDGITPNVSLEVAASSIEIKILVRQEELQPIQNNRWSMEVSENGEYSVLEASAKRLTAPTYPPAAAAQ